MTAVQALLLRNATQLAWQAGKRKREAVCASCIVRGRVVKQRRTFSFSSLWTADGFGKTTVASSGQRHVIDREASDDPAPARQPAHYDPSETLSAEDESKGYDVKSRLDDPIRPQDQNSTPRWEDEREDLWERLEQGEDEAFLDKNETETQRLYDGEPGGDDPLAGLDYASELDGALQNGDADLVARCLYAAERHNDMEFMRSISDSTFSDILHALEPRRFVGELASLHVELSAAMVKHLGITPLPLVAYNYSAMLWNIIKVRRRSQYRLTLADYAVLLRGARDLGGLRRSLQYWRILIKDGHKPDVICFNHHLSTMVWHGLRNPLERQNFRVIPFNMRSRQERARRAGYRSYRVRSGGIRERAMQTFDRLLRSKVDANEETFTLLIVAAAREGDLSTAESILNKVWSIDVKKLLAGDNEATAAPVTLPRESPLYPTSKLLFSIAHAYSINNDMPTALRLVDFVTRHYALDISVDVWNQLYEWTFVLAMNRTGTSRRDGSKTGELPRSSVLSLWNTMVGPPYFVQPTTGMYNYLIKNAALGSDLPLASEKIEEALVVVKQHGQEAHDALRDLERAIDHKAADTQSDSRKSLETYRNTWDQRKLIYERDKLWARRWMRLLLVTTRKWNYADARSKLCITNLPFAVWKWREFMPNRVTYEAMTGFVTIGFRTAQEVEQLNKDEQHAWTQEQNILSRAPKFIGDEWARTQPRVEDLTDAADENFHVADEDSAFDWEAEPLEQDEDAL